MRLRPLNDQDWLGFEAFAAKHFGSSHLSERSFNEHWFCTPWNREWAVRVLEDEEEIIRGIAMVIVVPGRFGTKQVPLAWISSMVVEDGFRSRGGGALLYLWIYKSFPLVGAMSGNENSTPINSVLGMEIPGVKMRRFIRVHDERAASLCSPAQHDAVRSAVARFVSVRKNRLPCRPVTAIPADYDLLWARFREKLYCTTERDRRYMEWRYLQAPHIHYCLVEMRLGGRLHAFAVLRFEPTPSGVVCRVLDMSADQESAVDAWCSVTELAESKGALFTDFMVIGTAQDEYLRDAGFELADAESGLDAIPHLLSPVEHRRWSGTFHMGGCVALADQGWRRPEAIYFTKGDGDRDWPTTYFVAKRYPLTPSMIGSLAPTETDGTKQGNG